MVGWMLIRPFNGMLSLIRNVQSASGIRIIYCLWLSRMETCLRSKNSKLPTLCDSHFCWLQTYVHIHITKSWVHTSHLNEVLSRNLGIQHKNVLIPWWRITQKRRAGVALIWKEAWQDSSLAAQLSICVEQCRKWRLWSLTTGRDVAEGLHRRHLRPVK